MIDFVSCNRHNRLTSRGERAETSFQVFSQFNWRQLGTRLLSRSRHTHFFRPWPYNRWQLQLQLQLAIIAIVVVASWSCKRNDLIGPKRIGQYTWGHVGEGVCERGLTKKPKQFSWLADFGGISRILGMHERLYFGALYALCWFLLLASLPGCCYLVILLLFCFSKFSIHTRPDPIRSNPNRIESNRIDRSMAVHCNWFFDRDRLSHSSPMTHFRLTFVVWILYTIVYKLYLPNTWSNKSLEYRSSLFEYFKYFLEEVFFLSGHTFWLKCYASDFLKSNCSEI